MPVKWGKITRSTGVSGIRSCSIAIFVTSRPCPFRENMELWRKPRFARLRYFASLLSSAKVYFFMTRWNERPVHRSFVIVERTSKLLFLCVAKTGRDARDGGDSRWTDHRAKTRAACFRGRQTWSVCVPRNTACEFALKKENISEKNTRLFHPSCECTGKGERVL